MLCWRRISAIGTPASPCFRISTIWLPVNRDFRMASPWPRKVYDQNVYRKGKLTPTPRDTLGAGVVNGVLYAVGGFSSGNFQATNEAYCPKTPPPTAPTASGRCR